MLTEAGFGSDLGAEKFFDIKCRFGGLKPEAAVLVATVRALKMNGGANKKNLATDDLGALEKGLPNLEPHIENVAAVRRAGDRRAQPLHHRQRRRARDGRGLRAQAQASASRSARCGRRAGAGGEELAREVLDALDKDKSNFKPLYDAKLPIKAKIETIARKVYGGDGVDYTPEGGPRHRVSRGDRLGRDAGLHGEDPVLLHRRRDQAGTPDGLPHHRERGVSGRRAPDSSSRWPATS